MKNRALRYLSRVIAVTGTLSFPKAVTNGTVGLQAAKDSADIVKRLKSAAHRDEQIREEAKAYAREQRWRLITHGEGHERWPRLDGSTYKEALPRVIRILRREAWEAIDMARDCDDEEVASLLHLFASERHALVGELSALDPVAATPGA